MNQHTARLKSRLRKITAYCFVLVYLLELLHDEVLKGTSFFFSLPICAIHTDLAVRIVGIDEATEAQLGIYKVKHSLIYR